MTWKRVGISTDRDITKDEGFWELVKFLNKECRYYKISFGWRNSVVLQYAPKGFIRPKTRARYYPRSLEESNTIFIRNAFEIAKKEVFY